MLAHEDDDTKSTDAVLLFRAGYTGPHYARITEWTNSGGSSYWYYLQVYSLDATYLPLVLK